MKLSDRLKEDLKSGDFSTLPYEDQLKEYIEQSQELEQALQYAIYGKARKRIAEFLLLKYNECVGNDCCASDSDKAELLTGLSLLDVGPVNIDKWCYATVSGLKDWR